MEEDQSWLHGRGSAGAQSATPARPTAAAWSRSKACDYSRAVCESGLRREKETAKSAVSGVYSCCDSLARHAYRGLTPAWGQEGERADRSHSGNAIARAQRLSLLALDSLRPRPRTTNTGFTDRSPGMITGCAGQNERSRLWPHQPGCLEKVVDHHLATALSHTTQH